MAVELDSTSAELLKLHCLNGAQDAAYDASIARQSMRLNHIAGVINQEEAAGSRIFLESGSGRVRDLDPAK